MAMDKFRSLWVLAPWATGIDNFILGHGLVVVPWHVDDDLAFHVHNRVNDWNFTRDVAIPNEVLWRAYDWWTFLHVVNTSVNVVAL